MVPMGNHAFQSAHQVSSVSIQLMLLASSGVEALWNRDADFYSLSPIGFLQLRLSHLSLSQALTYMGVISVARLVDFTPPEGFTLSQLVVFLSGL